MSTENKITEEELQALKEKLGAIQNINSQIGVIESQKHVLLHKVVIEQDELQKIQKQLEDKYGRVNINIADGTYDKAEEVED